MRVANGYSQSFVHHEWALPRTGGSMATATRLPVHWFALRVEQNGLLEHR